MSFIEEQPHGDWKDFLVGVRKVLDVEEGTWAGDEIDRVMRLREDTLKQMFEGGYTVEETAEGLLQDLDAWS